MDWAGTGPSALCAEVDFLLLSVQPQLQCSLFRKPPATGLDLQGQAFSDQSCGTFDILVLLQSNFLFVLSARQWAQGQRPGLYHLPFVHPLNGAGPLLLPQP